MNGLLVALMLAGGAAPPPPEPPPVTLEDFARFPSQSTVHETLQFINAHRAWLDQHRGKPWEEKHWQARREDIYWRWDVWDDLRIAHEAKNPETKVFFLGCVRKKIGHERFYLGQMPAPCAIWHFRRLD